MSHKVQEQLIMNGNTGNCLAYTWVLKITNQLIGIIISLSYYQTPSIKYICGSDSVYATCMCLYFAFTVHHSIMLLLALKIH